VNTETNKKIDKATNNKQLQPFLAQQFETNLDVTNNTDPPT
jgi:hypothetical protein